MQNMESYIAYRKGSDLVAYSSDPHVAQFFLTDVCAAVGISAQTLTNWISRDPPAVFLTDEDRKGKAGRGHLLTFQRVMQVALTAELMKFGMGPRRAGTLAATFTDTDAGYYAAGARREPGELFTTGLTVLVAYEGEEWATILNAADDTPLRNIFHPVESATKTARAAAVVWVNLIYAQVRAALYK